MIPAIFIGVALFFLLLVLVIGGLMKTASQNERIDLIEPEDLRDEPARQQSIELPYKKAGVNRPPTGQRPPPPMPQTPATNSTKPVTRYFARVKGFSDQTAYIRVDSPEYIFTVRKDGGAKQTEFYGFEYLVRVAELGVWKEITALEAAALIER